MLYGISVFVLVQFRPVPGFGQEVNSNGDVRHIHNKEPARLQLDSARWHRLVRLTLPGITGAKKYQVAAVRNIVAAIFQINGFEGLPLDEFYKIKRRDSHVRVIHANGDPLDNRVSNLRISLSSPTTQCSPQSLSSPPPAGSSLPLPFNKVEMEALMKAIEGDTLPTVELQPTGFISDTLLGVAQDDQEELAVEEAPPPKKRRFARSATSKESLGQKLLRMTAAEPVSWIVGSQSDVSHLL